MLVHLTKNQELKNEVCRKLQVAKKMAGDYYNIFVYRTSNNEMFVSAVSRRTNEMFLIELPFPKSKEVMASFN